MDERNVLIILNLSGNIDPVEKYISKRRKIYEKESSVSASLCSYDSNYRCLDVAQEVKRVILRNHLRASRAEQQR